MSPQLAAFIAFLRRYPFPAVCVILVLVCGGGAWWLSGDVDELHAVHADKTKEGEAMLALLIGGTAQRQELANARAATKRIEENLVTVGNLGENTSYLYQLETETKAQVAESHPLNTPITDTVPLYSRVPYSLRITGTYEQVASYVLRLETGPRLASITTFSCARRETGGTTLMMDLTVDFLGKK
jgi:Tfp pilus assembly protein PilO